MIDFEIHGMTTELYKDNFGRTVSLEETEQGIRIDLQDLAPDFEYERCLTVNRAESLANVLNVPESEVFSILVEMLKGRADCFDMFSEWLSENNISAEYYSG